VGAKTTTGSRKKTPVTSSHRMPPTLPKGRRNPPIPRATFRVALPADRLLAPTSTFVSGSGDLAFAADSALAVTCWPAIRPATRSPIPNVRPTE
jgi:hypothetical protein